MSYASELQNLKRINRGLMLVIVCLTVLVGYMAWGMVKAREDIHIILPPDLTNGAVVQASETPKSAVYSFASYIFQYLNHWPTDGDREYPERIKLLAAYLTPRYRAWLEQNIRQLRHEGELNARTRGLFPVDGAVYNDDRVKKLSDDSWVVFLDLRIRESVHGVTMKDRTVRYALRVVRFDASRELNPWGLALDGYYADPVSLSLKKKVKP